MDAHGVVDEVTEDAVESERAWSRRGRPRFLGGAAALGAALFAGGDEGGDDGDSRFRDWGESE